MDHLREELSLLRAERDNLKCILADFQQKYDQMQRENARRYLILEDEMDRFRAVFDENQLLLSRI